ncbi:MAG: single-stranded DNA-binding protein [Candidatus Doudnabacteria bacterium]|jgi:single-strand DNA-binding protein
MDLNKVMIIGRLTRDPELRSTPSGVNVCQIGVATSYVYTNQATGQKVEQTEFHNVVLWRKLGEIANQYLKKGAQVFIEGRLQTRSWDGKDGAKRYRTEIIGDNMIMLGKPSSGGTSSATGGYSAPSSAPTQAPKASSSTSQDFGGAPAPTTEELPTIVQGEDINVEDIPF